MKKEFEKKDNSGEAKPIPRRRSIFFRMLWLSWLGIISTVVIFVFITIPYQKEQLRKEMDMQAGVAFSSVSQIAESSIILEDYSAIVDHCLTLIQNSDRVLYVVLTKNDGFSLIHTVEGWSQKTLDGRWLSGRKSRPDEGRFAWSEIVMREVYNASFPFRYSGIDWGWIHIGLLPDKFYSDLKALYIRIALTSFLAISLGMVASFYAARQISGPVMLLDRVAKRIRFGDLSARARIQSGDEVESLAGSFNQMAAHLDAEIKEKEIEISERKSVEVALRESEERYRTIIESIEDGYYEADNTGTIVFANEVMCKILGYTARELIGMHAEKLIHENSWKNACRKFMRVFLSGRPVSVFELMIIRKDAEPRQMETSISLIQNLSGGKVGFRGVARDVNERKQQEKQLIYIAYHDALTGLKNRKWFYENLGALMAQACRYQYQIALLYIDIDKFKKVNDEMGHEAGDRLLCEVSARLRNCLRKTDSIARIGGDEFAVIVTSPREELLPEVVAEKIVASVGRPYTFDDIQVDYISASIGVAVFPEDAVELESLIRIADHAMYRAKVKRNCYITH